MINISDDAKKELKKLLSENTQESGAVLRLTANEQGQLGLVLDKESAEDLVIECEGVKVLVIEKHLDAMLEGISMAMENTPEGASLVLSQAGCGGGCCCGGEQDYPDESGCGGGSCCGGDKPC